MSRWPLEWVSRRAPKRLTVSLDAHGIALHDGGGDALDHATKARTHDTAALLSTLPSRTWVDVIVANDVAVHWLQNPPPGVRSLNELRDVAGARCAHLFGGAPSHWHLAGD